MSVDVFEWNPRRPVLRGRAGRMLPLNRPVNNFGDRLGPEIVHRIVALALGPGAHEAVTDRQLVSVGSILHLARPDAVVWGSGINGKVIADYTGARFDVRAVRGPRTRARLLEAGIVVPEVYGDPGLLIGHLFPSLRGVTPEHDVTVIMNLNDPSPRTGHHVVDPRSGLWSCLRAIASSRLVVGSSLHAIVCAEALGIPACPIESAVEKPFKYDDYFSGTGRAFEPVGSISEAVSRGGMEAPRWDAGALLSAFPFDLWSGGSNAGKEWLVSARYDR